MQKFRLALVGLLLLVLFILLFAAFNLTKLRRGLTYPTATQITNSDWYTPMSSVKGKAATKFQLADSLTIKKEILENVTNYAKERNSSALLVMHKGKLLVEEYWMNSNSESTTNSMSMAKTIIGILIGKAIAEGKIKSVKETAATYLPEWKNDDRSKITIEDLLLMQSGLENDDNMTNMFSDVIEMYVGNDVEKTVLAIPSVTPPATEYIYNNANTQILSIILERVTEQSIETYASEKLWQPLGASDANWWLDREEGMPKTFCCFFATAQDWLRLGQMILQKGDWNNQQVINVEWLEKMLIQSTIERDYGYHIWLMYEDGGRRAKDRTVPFDVKTYIIDGMHKQHVFIVPSLDLVVVRLGEDPDEWDESYMVNMISQSLGKSD